MLGFAFQRKRIFLLLSGVCCLILFSVVGILYSLSSDNEQVDFNVHIRPIINKKCITCHGGVKRS